MQEVQETQIPSLGLEDPLEKEMATHSIIPTWKIPWMEEPGRVQSIESWRVWRAWSPRLSEATLSAVSVTLNEPWCDDIKWKIPGTNDS